GDKDFRLPGIGSYMSVAVEHGRIDAMFWAIAAMVGMIVALDQLLWRPVVVWAQKFRLEEGGQQPAMSSWFLDRLRRSRLLAVFKRRFRRKDRLARSQPEGPRAGASDPRPTPWAGRLSFLAFTGLLAALLYGAWKLLGLLQGVGLDEWGTTVTAAGWT